MRTLLLITLAVILGSCAPDETSVETQPPEEWKKLYNEKNFLGWFAIPGGTWLAEDSIIIGRSDKSEKRHGLLVSEKRYKDFKIRLKYKAITGNSGLYFRVDTVSDEVGVNGFQAEIDPNKDAGGLYETGGRQWVIQPDSADVATWYRPNEWNEMLVSAIGNHIEVIVNDSVTAKLENDSGRTEGHIALQLHGNMDMEVLFRDLEILEIQN